MYVRPVSSDYGQDGERSFGPIFAKFGTQHPKENVLDSLRNGRGQSQVAEFVISFSLNYFCSR